ncbi:MAG: glycoside hydrolase family 20 zincin-like fold domain-containing protein [Candidatus Velthaea sp.]
MTVVRCLVPCALALCAGAGAARAAPAALVPAPAAMHALPCPSGGFALRSPLRLSANTDPGGFEIVRERWRALGIPPPLRAAPAQVRISRTARGTHAPAAQGYTLRIDGASIEISAADADGAFNALATLAQLPQRAAGGWMLPCVAVADAPALRWRVVSDDISRGPFPTMRYFKERIRTLAGFKINGWSPYMEHVFLDPAHPYVAFPDALTPRELRELAAYARRFHITLIPEQQTFAHMHETLKYEQLAPLAELPHGYLLAESDPATYGYLEPLLRAELAAARPPFFHLGADEPLDLGRGRTPRTPQVFADHVNRLAAVVRAGGARPMIWDDAIQQTPAVLALLPRSTVVVTFHYGAEASFAKYIDTIAAAGFEQLISPGANNWNEIYADLATAYANAAQFVADGKNAHVLGMFDTVWHDDGESLFEATWSPVAFAAASAWQREPVDRAGWHATFARAFFGTDDARFGADLDALEAIRAMLKTKPAGDPPNYLFWSDPFDARIQARMASVDIGSMRRRAEDVMAHLAADGPPLHAQAARVMRLAALRYDTLGRRFQIGKEVREYYDDARTHAAAHSDDVVYRGLNVAKYFCWELRDEMTALEPLYARAWAYESRPAGGDRVRVRYRLAAERAVTYADRLNAAARESYLRGGVLPPFEDALGLPK